MVKIILGLLLVGLVSNARPMDDPSKVEESSTSHLALLPTELKLAIFEFLPKPGSPIDIVKQILRFSRVNTEFSQLATDEQTVNCMLERCRKYFPDSSNEELLKLCEELVEKASLGEEIFWDILGECKPIDRALKNMLVKHPKVLSAFGEDEACLGEKPVRPVVTRKVDKKWCSSISFTIPESTPYHIGPLNAVAISSDDRFIVTGSEDKTAKIWDVGSGECIATLMGHTGEICSVAISGDDSFIVTGSYDLTAKIWDFDSGTCLMTLEGHKDVLCSVAISSNNQFIVTGSADETARLWDLSGKCTTILEGHNRVITSVAISSDNSFIVTGSWDDTAKIWDAKYGKCIATLEGHEMINSVAISNDNQFIVIGDSDGAKLWNLETKECIATLAGHTMSIVAIAISNDNSFIITGSRDGTAKMWDVLSGKLLHNFKYHNKYGISSVAISNDNSFIILCSNDTLPRVYPLPSGYSVDDILKRLASTVYLY